MARLDNIQVEMAELTQQVTRLAARFEQLTQEVARLGKMQLQLAAGNEDLAQTCEETLQEFRRGHERYQELVEAVRREEKRRLEGQVIAALVKELLPLLDGLEAGIQTFTPPAGARSPQAPPEGLTVVQGLAGLWQRGQQALAGLGVQRLEAVGQPFDPYYHRAVEAVPVAEEQQDGRVVAEVTAGYIWQDQVLRYAEVIVGKLAGTGEQPEAKEGGIRQLKSE
ncbi:nucleotide exchange factor GrpE [Moorella stamsii]|nr:MULTISPECIES: nucleotide exchange factor GrpE [Moorella]